MVAALALVTLGKLTLAAEFAPQAAVWLAWPTYDHKRGLSVSHEIATLAQTLANSVRVRVLIDSSKERESASALVGSHNVDWVQMRHAEIWMRDFGPSFLVGDGRRAVADFKFNYWGYEPEDSPVSRQHGQIDRIIAMRSEIPALEVGTIAEGGNHESNGEGTLMLVEAVERQRNPKLSIKEIEAINREKLGIDTFIWLPKGVVEDGMSFDGPIPGGAYLPITTGGHVDNIARFIDPATIALAEVTSAEAKKSPLAAENRKRLEAAFARIKAARDSQGRGFRVVRFPAPDLVTETMKPGDAVYDFLAELKYTRGHRFPKRKPIRVALASSYMNFVITNGLVVTSKFYRPGLPAALKQKDALVVSKLKSLFPGRKLVAMSSRAINLGGGGLHCVTMHEPK